MKFGVGQAMRRKEDRRLLTGDGRFIDDHAPEGALSAFVLRSGSAHARFTLSGLEEARAVPGVRLVYVHQDIADRLIPLTCLIPIPQRGGGRQAQVAQPHLADGTVRYVGEPVAFIVADTLDRARDAAELIEVDYDEAPVVVDAAAALAPGAPNLHETAPGNLAYDWEAGDEAAAAAAFAGAAHVVRAHVVNQRLAVTAMETRGALIRYDAADGRWEGWIGSQGAHAMRDGVAQSLGVEPSRLRIHAPDIGGGFGMKTMQHPEYALVALAAKDSGQPVKWIADRAESFLSDAQARDLQVDIEGAFDADGRLLALRSDGVSNLGAYYSTCGLAVHTLFSSVLIGGLYRVPAAYVRVRGALTNTTPTDAYRGAGRPEVIHNTERLMSAAARQIGMDPVALRRINLLTPEETPYATLGGLTFDSLDPARVIDVALEAADYDGFSARAEAAAAQGRVRGRAAIYYMERTGGGPDENAEITISAEGDAVIHVGTQSTGQGHETTWAQILHENLGLEWDRISLADGDSDALPLGGGTGGSRSAIMASRVIRLAADEIIRKCRAAAAEELEAAEEDVEFLAAESAFIVAGTDRRVGLPAVVRALGGVTGFGKVSDTTASFPNGCHIAEVEIDRETGRVSLERYTLVDDFGVIINPLLAGGQAQGGVAQGVGQALLEHAVYDPETGQPLAGSFMDYAVPRADDLPALEPHFVEIPCQTNPYGVKGGGESGTVAGIPAATLAVHDALIRAGGREIEGPFTPFRVWTALRRD
ncbi:xanthine dehydrogenase family protein molybdopterin-binding subunit [Pikeienuella sp. HZG-20]|uniref:xanthine dehydrogenase family protein molybdopterin-binding subunit n=1 Tax=Paludibacillus litoralis TaxID=3133267 RepID=UPI0030EDB413